LCVLEHLAGMDKLLAGSRHIRLLGLNSLLHSRDLNNNSDR
jgi:hypothetical protein